MKIPENLWLQDIKKTEYIFLAVKSIAVILLNTYVFYESFLPIFFMIPIWVIYARDGLRDLCRKKEKEFRVQFSNAIQAMGAALKAGYSVENAIREAEKDLAPMYEENVRIRKEFRKNTQFSANIFVDNVSVVSLDASFSLDDPQVPVINRYISDGRLYRANKQEIDTQVDEFENTVWDAYDKMMAENK